MEEAYNKRVEEALSPMVDKKSTYVIKEEGRTKNEQSVVLVEKGVYKGYGYISKKKAFEKFQEYLGHIIPKQDNRDIHKILKRYIRRSSQEPIFMDHQDEPSAIGKSSNL
jgi:DNA polymerase-3 subunit epsilon